MRGRVGVINFKLMNLFAKLLVFGGGIFRESARYKISRRTGVKIPRQTGNFYKRDCDLGRQNWRVLFRVTGMYKSVRFSIGFKIEKIGNNFEGCETVESFLNILVEIG